MRVSGRKKVEHDKSIRRPFVQSSRAWVTSMVLGRRSSTCQYTCIHIQLVRTYLALTVRPKVRSHANDVVQPRVCALVDQQRIERAERVYD